MARRPGLRLGHGPNGVRPAPEFTERQYAVLTCLCLGDPNKVIGRKLGMTETTVKVHVREIMRKLGVCNRTQVAIAAARNGTGIGPDSVVEIIPWIPRRRSIHLGLISWREFPTFCAGTMGPVGFRLELASAHVRDLLGVTPSDATILTMERVRASRRAAS